ncbi:MAG: hypothetical protein ACK5ME_06020 [Parahaliea sp.]
MTICLQKTARALALGIFIFPLFSAGVAAQNMIANPGFDDIEASRWGNNRDADISPWIIGGGGGPNVVKVNGVRAYGTGPTRDANPATGSGEVQQYLDVISARANDFYQIFTVPQCGILPAGQTRTVDFSGWFSPRREGGGVGTLTIREGAGLGGTVLATATATVPTDTTVPPVYPWLQTSGSVVVPTGTQITYVVSMGGSLNFDEALMEFSDISGACPTARLILAIEWAGATVGDEVTFRASDTRGLVGELVSAAASASHTETLATPVYVASGDVINLADILSALNQSSYTPAFNCSGAGALTGSVLTVDDTGDSISCTLTLSRNASPGGNTAEVQPVPLMPIWILVWMAMLMGVLARYSSHRFSRT